MKKGLFIAFEGIDGAGKSTHVTLLKQKLESEGYKVYVTCEPTRDRIGSIIRDIFTGKMKADHKVVAGLFVADRLHHLLEEKHGIVARINEGYTVITDRYYFSSYAYQGAHMDIDWVIEANKFSAKILRPDLNLFIDVPPEESMKRISENRDGAELYENLENLELVRSKYMEAFDKLKNQEEIIMIEGIESKEVIAENIWKAVKKIL